jgi:hypothetical protein
MELKTTREATSCAATREITSILCNQNVHYRIHKSSPLVPNRSQSNPVNTPPPTYLSLSKKNSMV